MPALPTSHLGMCSCPHPHGSQALPAKSMTTAQSKAQAESLPPGPVPAQAPKGAQPSPKGSEVRPLSANVKAKGPV